MVLSGRLIAASGSASQASVTSTELDLSQPLQNAIVRSSVSLTGDLAVRPAAVKNGLHFNFQRGGIPGSTLRISLVTPTGLRLLSEVQHQGSISADPEYNGLPVTLDLASLRDVPPQQVTLQRPDVPKMAWAFYYGWYRTVDWDSHRLKDHPLTPYSSRDTAAMVRQIDQARSAGIDGFIVSWWGQHDFTDRYLKLFLDTAAGMHFPLMIYFETLTPKGALRSADEIETLLAYAISTYRAYPGYFLWDGKPAIAIYSSDQVPLSEWKSIFAKLHAQGLDAVYLGMGLGAANLDVFSGIHIYAPISISNLAQSYAQASQLVRYAPLLSDDHAPRLWAATIQPGYDDRLLPGRKGTVQDRANGAYYQSTIQAALQSDPDWLLVTSWNEWWENTEIEPGQLYGDQYLRLTRAAVDRWKNAAPTAPTPVP